MVITVMFNGGGCGGGGGVSDCSGSVMWLS